MWTSMCSPEEEEKASQPQHIYVLKHASMESPAGSNIKKTCVPSLSQALPLPPK